MKMHSPDFLLCNFCGKSEGKVFRMVAGPAVYICNQCVLLCVDVLLQDIVKDNAVLRAAIRDLEVWGVTDARK